jgi:hypothetical protein
MRICSNILIRELGSRHFEYACWMYYLVPFKILACFHAYSVQNLCPGAYANWFIRVEL